MRYIIQRLKQEDVYSLLMRCEKSFTPPLSCNIPYSMDEYASRLSANASFVLAVDKSEILGFLAYYTNLEGRFAFIPQIWVSDMYQRKGIGAALMRCLIDNLPKEVSSLRLEVRKNNSKAVSFYYKMGFGILSEKENKLLLGKAIEENLQ